MTKVKTTLARTEGTDLHWSGDEIPHGTKLSPWRHNEKGFEILDPTPMQPPLGYKKSLSLAEQIAQQVRRMKLEILQDDDVTENDDEADDFEVGDDFEPLSPHENDHIPSIKELKARAKAINDQIREANRRAAIEAHENAIRKPASVNSPPAQPPNNDLTLKGKPSEENPD